MFTKYVLQYALELTELANAMSSHVQASIPVVLTLSSLWVVQGAIEAPLTQPTRSNNAIHRSILRTKRRLLLWFFRLAGKEFLERIEWILRHCILIGIFNFVVYLLALWHK